MRVLTDKELLRELEEDLKRREEEHFAALLAAQK